MKYTKLLSTLLVASSLFVACSGGSSASSAKDPASDNSATSGASRSGNATFSCVIDGQPVSGGIIDDGLQQTNGYQSNVAYIVDVDQGKELLFYLSDPKSTNSQGVHSLRFAVPDKTGNSTFGPDENGWGIEVDIIINKGHTARYNSDSFTINVSSLSATSVTGTFSGKFTLNGNINDADKKAIEVTDGKFDIPFSTGNMRPA
jgi:hypothetical protein